MIHLFKYRITLQRFGYQLALGLSKKYQRHISCICQQVKKRIYCQDKPSWVTAEVTPQHLLLSQCLWRSARWRKWIRPCDRPMITKFSGFCSMAWLTLSPPITLLGGESKSTNTPSGMPGKHRCPWCSQARQGTRTVAQVSNWMSKAVAKAYGIPKRVRSLLADADLVLVDLTPTAPFCARSC